MQMLLDLVKDIPGTFKFAGVRICSRAFQKLTGISSGTLQNIRNKIEKGVVSI